MHVLGFGEYAHGNDHAWRTMSLIDVTVCTGVLAACCVVCIIYNGQVRMHVVFMTYIAITVGVSLHL